MMPFVVPAQLVGKEQIEQVGGKAAHLGELIKAGFPVPEAFCVTVEAWDKFLGENKLPERIKEVLARTKFDDVDSLTRSSEEIVKMIVEAKVPLPVREAIIKAYKGLSYSKENVISILSGAAKSGAGPEFVALRSSAVVEDIEKASSAGQYESFLNVRGDESMLLHVQKCWASFFTPRAMYYRNKHGQPEIAGMGVIVQRMVNSEKSGVTFTVDPANPKDSGANQIITEAVWGLGETVVQGLVDPDYYVVDKKTGKILEKKIGKKTIMRVRDPKTGSTVQLDVKPEKVGQQVLTDTEIVALSAYGKKIEEYYKGLPQDIEWAVEKGKIYILQTRAVTMLEKKEVKELGKGEVLIKGFGVSPGVGVGPVKIIVDPSELGKIEKGDVLVTKMTAPDYVVAMEKSSAIVTDAGGNTCFAGDIKILTNRGFMAICDVFEHVSSGEKLLTLSVDSNTLKTTWRTIIRAQKRKSKTWKIIISPSGRGNQNALHITPDHKMLTFSNRKLIPKQIKDLLTDNESVLILDKIKPFLLFDGGNQNSMGYFCGAMFTDGSLRVTNRGGYCVDFFQDMVPSKIKFISSMKEEFNRLFGYKVKIAKDKRDDNIALRCYSKNVFNTLNSIKNNIENWVLSLNEEETEKFLAGVIDGDGCASDHQILISVGRKKEYVLQGIILACLKLGIMPHVIFNGKWYVVALTEKVSDILKHTKRVKKVYKRRFDSKIFRSKQILSDIIDYVNPRGRIKGSYIKRDISISKTKIENSILPKLETKKLLKEKGEILRLINSDLRMWRAHKCCEEDVQSVYNLTVDAKSDTDHNYIVFTNLYTPVVVGNCHAAIVGRELGLPVIVGTKRATQVLKDGKVVTVDASNGVVYAGEVEGARPAVEVAPPKVEKTRTEVKCNIAFPQTAERAKHADGVGLLRLEHMLTKAGMHPVEYIREGKADELTKIIVEGVGQVAEAFKPKPLWVRTLDARTDEFRNMKGGEKEPKEDNPMLGWHGIRRDLDEPELFKAQIEAFKQLHEKGYTNVAIMLPFVINVGELRKAKELAKKWGLPETVKFGIMIETPAAAINVEGFCKEGIDFVSFGSNDLTQLVLGIDRNNERLINYFNEMHPAMQFLFEHAIKICKREGVKTSICGELPSNREDAVEFLIKAGIDSVSVNIDAIDKVRGWVSRIEGRD